MKKVYSLLIITIVIMGIVGSVFLVLILIPKTIYIQSNYITVAPQIDGNFNATEWLPAYSINFTLKGTDEYGRTEKRGGGLYVMNNATHLFLAFRIWHEDYDGPPSGTPDKLNIWLDTNNNEELDDYEDIKILFTSSTPYIDAYHYSPPWVYIYPDSNHGGTTDGYAFWNHSNPSGTGVLTFETVFPFISDDPNDLNISRGITIGINFEYWSLTTSSHYFIAEWPADTMQPQKWAKLTIG